MRRGHIWLVAFGLLMGAVLFTPAGRAWAHAAYDHSTPAKDEVVPAAPAQVDVFFKQNVFRQTGTSYVRVFADDGTTQVSTGDGTLDDANRRHMFAPLQPGLPNGRYIVEWHTLSDEDGEEDGGKFCFYVATQPTAAQQTECTSFEPTPVPTLGGSTAQATSSSTAIAATPAATKTTTNKDGGGSNTGVIIGIIAGVAVAVVVVGGAALWWRSRQA